MAHQATNGALSAGALIVVITLATQLSTSMGSLALSMGGVGGSMQAADRLVWLRQYSSEERRAGRKLSAHAPAAPAGVALPEALVDGIQFEHLYFHYSDDGPDVLSDIDCSCPPERP